MRDVKDREGTEIMPVTWGDVADEMAYARALDEAVMERAKREQCVFLFVEGESEKIAFPLLLGELIDLDELGVVIAVYNGNGNLYTALRLLSQTLSSDRPVVATYDNDPGGARALRRYEQSEFVSDRVRFFPVPTSPIVQFPSGHRGGSFEESFEQEDFLDACFSTNVVPKEISSRRRLFEQRFDPAKPWLEQVRKFDAESGYRDWTAKKPQLAERLASSCAAIPHTYIELADVIRQAREEYPVRHPYDVEGLT